MSYRCTRCSRIDLNQTEPPYKCVCGNVELYEDAEES